MSTSNIGIGGGTASPPPPNQTWNASDGASEAHAAAASDGISFWALLVHAQTHLVYPLLIASGLLCNALAIVTLSQRNMRTNLTYFRYACARTQHSLPRTLLVLLDIACMFADAEKHET